MKSGASGLRAARARYRFASPSGVRGGKNSKENVGRSPLARISSIRIAGQPYHDRVKVCEGGRWAVKFVQPLPIHGARMRTCDRTCTAPFPLSPMSLNNLISKVLAAGLAAGVF